MSHRPLAALLLLSLASCGAPSHHRATPLHPGASRLSTEMERWSSPGRNDLGMTATLPMLDTRASGRSTERSADDPMQDAAGTAPDSATLPIGVGLALAPSAFLLGASLDFPLDRKLTVGPALQVALDDDDSSFAPFVQAKFFPELDLDPDPDSFVGQLRPYAQAGVGYAWVDREGRNSQSDLLVNVGAGIRYRTGDAYRIGTNILFNFLPGDPAGESFFITWELVQVNFDF